MATDVIEPCRVSWPSSSSASSKAEIVRNEWRYFASAMTLVLRRIHVSILKLKKQRRSNISRLVRQLIYFNLSSSASRQRRSLRQLFKVEVGAGSKTVVKSVSCVRAEFFRVKNDGRGREPGEVRNWKNVGGTSEGRNRWRNWRLRGRERLCEWVWERYIERERERVRERDAYG